MAANTSPATVKGLLRHYGETTSVKGVPKVLKSRRKPLQLLWLLAVLFGGGMAAYQLTSLLIKYFSYLTTTKLQEINKAPEFPDVTVCNLNPLKEMSVADVTAVGDVTADDMSQALRKFANENPRMSGRAYEYFAELLPDVNVSAPEMDAIGAAVFSTSGYFQSLPYGDLASTARELREVLFRDCVFYSWDMAVLDLKCDETTVTGFFFPEHFMCYTISVPEDHSHKVKGVSSIFYLGKDAHATFPLFNLNLAGDKSKGMKVVVHPRHSLPSLTDGDSVAPGHESTIRLTPTYTEMLPEPYGECVDRKYLEYTNEYTPVPGPVPPYLYTADSCRNHCYQDYVIRKCSCFDPIHRYTLKQALENLNTTLCGNTTFIKTTSKGVKEIDVKEEALSVLLLRFHCALKARQSVDDLNCTCLKACKYIRYTRSISQTPWPTTDHQLGLVSKYIYGTTIHDHFKDYTTLLEQYTVGSVTGADNIHQVLSQLGDIEKSFLQVNILLTDKRYEVVSEHAVITWDIILANMGGAFNLWIGISFITLIEMCDLLYNLIIILRKGGMTTTPKTAVT